MRFRALLAVLSQAWEGSVFGVDPAMEAPEPEAEREAVEQLILDRLSGGPSAAP